MKNPTLVKYWDKLSAQQRRLIHDLLRGHVPKYSKLPIGLLPFVPVKVVIKMLGTQPSSPWTQALLIDEMERDYDRFTDPRRRQMNDRYNRSIANDAKDYAAIMEIIDVAEPTPKLAVLLEKWRERNGGDDASN